MPGRYTIGASPELLTERFDVEIPDDYKPRYNAAPTQLLPVITNTSPKGLSFFYWGIIPGWSKNKSISTKLINAMAETLNEKASFKNSLKSRRCIVPADGYYEWKRISKKGKVPYRIILNNNEPFSFAGLWEEFEDDNEKVVHTFTIITTEPNDMVKTIHDRMPVILDSKAEKVWLDNKSKEEDLMEVLKSFPSDKMGNYTVSPKVNDVEAEGQSLIQPSVPIDQFGNYSLFD